MRHIRECALCRTAIGLRTHLCSRGYGYAKDVLQYVHFKRGIEIPIPIRPYTEYSVGV